jgi:hypothetical protein
MGANGAAHHHRTYRTSDKAHCCTSCSEANSSMTTPSLRVLGNLCSGNSESTQMVVDSGGVPAIIACLKVTRISKHTKGLLGLCKVVSLV